jgi:group I intron endonuclease
MPSSEELDNVWRTWKFAGIYGIVHIESGKIYVGQSNNIAIRVANHRTPLSGCLCIRRAIQKHGWDAFNVFLLDQVDDLTKLTEYEQRWINYFESYKPENGYNISSAADSAMRGRKHTPEARAKISAASTGRYYSPETRAKMGHIGEKFTEERKSKIRAALRSNPGKHWKKVSQFDKDGLLIKTWNNQAEAARLVGIKSRGSISMCCNGERKTAGGFIWKFTTDDEKVRLTEGLEKGAPSCLTPQNV